MISLQQMKYIVALVDLQQFGIAAKFCNVTQPTLSMQLKKAELELGFAIFERDQSALNLTDFGRKLLPIIRNTLDEFAKINYLVASQSNDFQEHLRIGVIPTIASYLLPEMFNIWKTELPHIQMKIYELPTEQLLQSLKTKEIDCAIMAGDFDRLNLDLVPVFVEEIMVYTRMTIKDDSLYISDLKNEKPWLLGEGNCLRNQMIDFCGINKDEQSIEWDFIGGNLYILKKLVDKNGGYTVIPKNCGSQLGILNELKSIKNKEGMIPARQNVCVFPKRTSKFGTIEKIIRSLQFQYANKNNNTKYTFLPWK